MQSLVSAVVEPGLAGWTETLDFAKFIVKLSRTLTRLNSNEFHVCSLHSLYFKLAWHLQILRNHYLTVKIII